MPHEHIQLRSSVDNGHVLATSTGIDSNRHRNGINVMNEKRLTILMAALQYYIDHAPPSTTNKWIENDGWNLNDLVNELDKERDAIKKAGRV